jgi:type IV pilus assembly protein PilV
VRRTATTATMKLFTAKNRRLARPLKPLFVKQSGFTLLEVMISLVILAIGVLGVISMQINTYQDLQSSHNYSQAAMIGSNMADRMLANFRPLPVVADNYEHDWDDGRPTWIDCTTIACTTAELRDYDIFVWQILVTGREDEDDPDKKIQGSLPSGSGEVVRDGITNNFDITVRWDDDLSGSAGQDCDTTDDEDLDCYVLRVRLQ